MLQNLATKVRDLLSSRKDDIDKGLDKAEQAVSDRTGGKYDEQIDSIRQKADDALGDEQTAPGSDTSQGGPSGGTSQTAPGDDTSQGGSTDSDDTRRSPGNA